MRGILGRGEVGKAIAEVMGITLYKDVDKDTIKDTKLDVLHIALPIIDDFVDVTVKQIKLNKPRLVLIESSVPVGTTRKIVEQTNCLIAHSPVRGVHPNLAEGIRTFVKFVGGIDIKSMREAEKYYRKHGIKTFGCVGPETTELGKLLSTTYYGMCIIYQKEVFKLCQRANVDPSIVYDLFNLTYNKGYSKLGMKHVVRPVLAQMPGKIGGHCIEANTDILEKGRYNNPISRFVKERNLALDK